jgi:hypothetical protein
MQLRFLLVTGSSCEPATVEFGPGLNVIYGGSNTGKSHVLRLIDYTLGARDPPEPITEQAGYDLVHLGLILDDGSKKTIVRALQGGNIKVIDGLVQHRPVRRREYQYPPSIRQSCLCRKCFSKNSMQKALGFEPMRQARHAT